MCDSNEMGESPTATKNAGGSPNGNKHTVRVVGSYSLLTFFKEEAQKEFLKLTSDPEFQETIISFDDQYTEPDKTAPFKFSKDAQTFELRGVQYGFIREAIWNESFMPIFKLAYGNGMEESREPDKFCRKFFDAIFNTEQLRRDIQKKCWDNLHNYPSQSGERNKDKKDREAENCILFLYALMKIPRELFLMGEREIYVSLHKFGIADVGLKFFVPQEASQDFHKTTDKLYSRTAHLQEDPLVNFKTDFKAVSSGYCCTNKVAEFLNVVFPSYSVKDRAKALTNFGELYKNLGPKVGKNTDLQLFVSYFQVFAIAIIHRFLFEKLSQFTKNNIHTPCNGWQEVVHKLADHLPRLPDDRVILESSAWSELKRRGVSG